MRQAELDDLERTPLYGDFDGDSRVDAASWLVTSGCPSINVRLAARSAGPLAVTPAAGCGPTGYVADVNGDRFDDLLVMADDGTLSRALSKGDGTFTSSPQAVVTVAGAAASVPWAGSTVDRRCATSDFDGDQFSDLACLYSAGANSRLGILRATRGRAMLPSDVPGPAGVSADNVINVMMAVGDVDNSTTNDLVFAVPDSTGHFTLITALMASNGTIASWPAPVPTTWPVGNLTDWKLAAADVDGDARADVVLLGRNTHGFGHSAVALSENGASPRLVPQPVVTTDKAKLAIGDVDGDGRADLLSGDPAGVQRSTGDGSFGSWQALPAGGQACSRPLEVASAGDVNGDGQSDLLCSRLAILSTGKTEFRLWQLPSPVAAPALHRWAVFDGNGDGRQDLYTTFYRNPGYQLYTLTAKPGGGYTPVSEQLAAPATGPGLDNPDAGGWLPADVAGPQGTADGHSDLVLPGRAPGGSLRVATAQLKESGWTVLPCPASTPTCITGTDVPDGRDLQAWRPARVNDDDLTDLVRFRPLSTGARLEYLLAQGDGTWSASRRDAFSTGTAADGDALTEADVDGFRDLDLNGDGIDDFTHVEVVDLGPRRGCLILRSLVSTGPGTWREEQRRNCQDRLESAAGHALQPLELDGDGVPDLGRAVVQGDCVFVQAYLRRGDQWDGPHWLAGTGTACQQGTGIRDLRNLRLADVNGDGKTDVTYLSRVGLGQKAKTAVRTLLDPGDWRNAWTGPPAGEYPLADPDTWAYQPMDANSDGAGELVHAAPAALNGLRFAVGDDLITGIDGGRGATTTIDYRTQPGARSYLPPAVLPTAVSRITVTDHTYDPPQQDTAAFTYDAARWSSRYRQLAGYASITSHQGNTVVVSGNDLGDTCGTRPVSTAIKGADGVVLATTATDYKPTGTAAPYLCQAATVTTAECDKTGTCQENQTAYKHYDAYGNADTVEESGHGGAPPGAHPGAPQPHQLPRRPPVQAGTPGPRSRPPEAVGHPRADSVRLRRRHPRPSAPPARRPHLGDPDHRPGHRRDRADPAPLRRRGKPDLEPRPGGRGDLDQLRPAAGPVPRVQL